MITFQNYCFLFEGNYIIASREEIRPVQLYDDTAKHHRGSSLSNQNHYALALQQWERIHIGRHCSWENNEVIEPEVQSKQ